MWQEPKTDWTADDYFNLSDYNRIKNNIAYLRELALEVYTEFPWNDMGADKTSYTEYPYAYEFDVQKQWYENVRTPNYEDFNRLERACLLFYSGFNGIKENKRRLPFRLGAFKAIRV